MELIYNKHTDNNLLTDIRQLIESAKTQVAVTVNSTMTMMYWHIGDRIHQQGIVGWRKSRIRETSDSNSFAAIDRAIWRS